MSEECSDCSSFEADLESANNTLEEFRGVIEELESEKEELRQRLDDEERTCSNLRDLARGLAAEIERLENIIQKREFDNEKLARTVSTHPN